MCDDTDSLCRSTEVVSCMRAGKFESNCGLGSLRRVSRFKLSLLLIYMSTSSTGFLVRHGYLTSEIEHAFVETNQRLHGRFYKERW